MGHGPWVPEGQRRRLRRARGGGLREPPELVGSGHRDLGRERLDRRLRSAHAACGELEIILYWVTGVREGSGTASCVLDLLIRGSVCGARWWSVAMLPQTAETAWTLHVRTLLREALPLRGPG